MNVKPRRRKKRKGGGFSWSSYWATLISATVENAAPTHVVLTFPSEGTSIATDITATVNGTARVVSSASWTGAVWTLVLASAVASGDIVVVTFVPSGGTATVTNNVYILYDTFATDEAAPMASPRTCEPTGAVTITDTGERLSADTHNLIMAAGTTQFYYYSAAAARTRGLSVLFTATIPTAQAFELGFTDGSLDNRKGSFRLSSSLSYVHANDAFLYVLNDKNIQKYVLIQRSSGVFFCGYIDNRLQLLFVDSLQAHANTEVMLSSVNTSTFTGKLRDLKITRLPSPFNTEFGLATNRVAAPADGEITTMTANGQVDFRWVAGTGEVLNLMFRRVDDDNCWIARCDQANSKFYLIQKEAGTETVRGTAGGITRTFTAGTAYNIIACTNRNEISIHCPQYSTGAGANTNYYASATFNNTATGVRVSGFASGTELITWPRELPQISSVYFNDTAKYFLASGDSKTAAGTYQPLLLEALKAQKTDIWNYYTNCATSGYTVSQLLTKVNSEIPVMQHAVDYVLLNIGINDVTVGPTGESVFKAAYLGLLDAFHARWPLAKVYCMRVWGRTWDAQSDIIDGYIDDCIALRSTFAYAGPDERIFLENGDDGATYMSDTLHPNAAGYAETAAQWQAAIGY